jgi:hypothetical protein
MKHMLWHIGILLVTGVVVHAQSHQTPQRAASQTQVEEIYVGRSVSESRAAPTEFCAPAKTGLGDPMVEGRYSFRSISINASDGRVLDANVKPIGSGHGCFGPTIGGIRKIYAELTMGSRTFIATGECRQKSDFPERGINEFHCSADLSAPDDDPQFDKFTERRGARNRPARLHAVVDRHHPGLEKALPTLITLYSVAHHQWR